MTVVLNVAWFLVVFLKYAGLAVALVGVAIFGWFFVRLNARAARGPGNEVPAASWRGPGAMRGVKLVGIGIIVQIASVILAVLLPGRL